MKIFYLLLFFILYTYSAFTQCVIPITATANPTVICRGQQTQLSADIVHSTCGVSPACSGNTQSPSVGAGATIQPGSPTQSPTLMGNFNQSGRNQMLYLASELTPALSGACVLKRISFNIMGFQSGVALNSFTVKIGCTNLASLSTWENNLTTVFFSAAGVSPVLGWNTITLQTPYAWDGTSNIIVDICWNNPSNYGSGNNKAECTNTAFNSYLYLMGAANMCGTTAAPSVSSLRPNVRFNYCISDIDDYNILWSPNTGVNGVTDPDSSVTNASPTVTQSYIITVTDGLGCTGSDTVLVQVDSSRVNAGSDVNACPGVVTTFTATTIGTIIPGPPTYAWTTLSGTSVGNTQSVNVNPSTTTSYIVSMSGGGCVKHDTVTINVSGLTVNAATTNATCNGANNGKIHVTSNGVAPFTYVWSPNVSTIDSAVNLAPDNYSVTVTDNGGCTGSATAQITQPTPVAFTSNVTHNTCFGGTAGSITVNPSGGTGSAYTYQWSNSGTTQTINSLVANTYTVTVRDVNLCTATSTFNISEPTEIIFGTATIRDVRCFGESTGQITVNATGGIGQYTYSWSHNLSLNSPTAAGLSANTYIVTIHDANNCSVSASYTVSQPANGLTLNAPNITNVTCFGENNGSATVNPTGGTPPYIFMWNPSGQTMQTATGLSAQTYNVTVTDDSLCTATAQVTVNQPPQISIAGSVTNVFCNGGNNGAVDITVSNGVSPLGYLWSNTAVTQDIANLFQGNYRVTVTDNTSCTQSASFTVTEPSVLVLNAATINNVSCFGGNNGSVTANPAGGAGGYTYTWNPASGNGQTISSLSSGLYFVTVEDVNSCSASASYLVTEPFAPVTFNAPNITHLSCNGASTGSITVNVSGGTGTYSYSWSHNTSLNSPTATGLSANTYTVTATDSVSCTASASYTITQPAAITFSAPEITPVTCFGYNDGTAEIFPSGGMGNYTYTWNGNAGGSFADNLAAGNYMIIVTDSSNCSASSSITITEPSPFSVNLTPEDATCNGASNGSIDAFPVGGTPGFLYQWSNNNTTSSAFGLRAGVYFVTVTDANNCSISASATVSEPAPLTYTVSTTQVKCPGDQNGTITIHNLQGGTAPYNYSATQDWSNFLFTNNGVIENLASGYYAVIVADDNGCTLVDTAFVPSPVADVFEYTADSTSCYGSQYSDGAVYIEGLTIQNMPYQYGVDGGALSFSGDLYNLTAGNHIVNVVNHWGCTTDVNVVVPEPAAGVASVFPADTTIRLGESIQLTSSFIPYSSSSVTSYWWSPSNGLSCVDCPNPVLTTYSRSNQYTFTVIYNEHCTATATVNVSVVDTLKFFIPNSFSPNGDGNNDTWLIYGEGIKSVDLKIFNRWGELVYETTNPFAGWDGTYKGMLQNPAVFVYSAKVTFLDDRETERVGSITLLR